MDKSTHEEHLSQPLQTNIKQFKMAVTFLTSFNGIFNDTNEKKINFVSQNQIVTNMVLSKLPYHLVHTKSKV